MIFLMTNEEDDWAYICRSNDRESFTFCLDDTENAYAINIVQAVTGSNGTFYLIERRLDRWIRWDVSVLDTCPCPDEIVRDDYLYIVEKDMLNNEKQV